LVSGPWAPYFEAGSVTKEKALSHQEKQKKISDWPACLTALKLLAQGRFEIDLQAKEVYLNRKKLPAGGYEMKTRGKKCAESLGF
jgi:hypothetical protein